MNHAERVSKSPRRHDSPKKCAEKKPPKPSPFFNLPVELVVMIFCCFERFRDAFCLSMACHRMHGIFAGELDTIFNRIAASRKDLKWPKQARQMCTDLKGHYVNGLLTPGDIMKMLRTEFTLRKIVNTSFWKRPTPTLPIHLLPRVYVVDLSVPPQPGQDDTTQMFPTGKILAYAALRFHYHLLSFIVIPWDVMLARMHTMKLRQICLLENAAWGFDPRILHAISAKWQQKELAKEGMARRAFRKVHKTMEELLCQEHARVQRERHGRGVAPREGKWHIRYGYGVDARAHDDIWQEGPVEDDFPKSIYRHWSTRSLKPGNS